jgi:hypothetical protein
MKTKKLFGKFVVSLLVLTAAACSKSYDDGKLWNAVNSQSERIEALETWQKQVNANISSLQGLVTAVQDADYIVSMEQFYSGTGGYILTLKSGKQITIYNGAKGEKGDTGADGEKGETGATGAKGETGSQGDKGDKGDTGDTGAQGSPGATGAKGADGSTPVISVKQDTDGIYYWTLNGEFILDDSSNKLPVTGNNGKDGTNGEKGDTGNTGPKGETGSQGDKGDKGDTGDTGAQGSPGITPQLRINTDTNLWEVSYNNGVDWTSLDVLATGADGQNGADGQDGSAFDGVDNTNPDYVTFILGGGSEIVLPRYKLVDVLFSQPAGFGENQTKSVAYTLQGNATIMKVVDVTEGWSVKINKTSETEGTFKITSPANFTVDVNTYGEAVVLVSDGGERTAMRMLQLGAGITSLSITNHPTKTDYGINEPFDMTGMTLDANITGGGTMSVPFNASNLEYDFSSAGQTMVYVNVLGSRVGTGVTVKTLADRINDGQDGAVIYMYADESLSGVSIDGKKIYLRGGNSTVRTITLSTATGRMFTVASAQYSGLDIANVQMVGSSTNTMALIHALGELQLGVGASVTGNTNRSTANNGGGVYVGATGTCKIVGGAITGNATTGSTGKGGGVYVAAGGTLQMASNASGRISENSSLDFGGGVFVEPNGTLNISAGVITSNTTPTTGKDVYADCSDVSSIIKISSSGRIGNICLYAPDAIHYTQLTIGTLAGSDKVIETIDFHGVDDTIAEVREVWLDHVVLAPTVKDATINPNRFNPLSGKFYNVRLTATGNMRVIVGKQTGYYLINDKGRLTTGTQSIFLSLDNPKI